jgi:glycerol-3-phosphate dehydrogenase
MADPNRSGPLRSSGHGEKQYLGQIQEIPSHKAISPEDALRLQPIIKGNGLTGASLFYDCVSICPERLALAFIKSALHYGARAANYARVTGFLLENKRVCGVRVQDLLMETEFEVKARVTINCAGPWADHVLALLLKN